MKKISFIAGGLLCMVAAGYSYLNAQRVKEAPVHPVANPYEVSTTPDHSHAAWRPGEVIVKFRTESAVAVRNNSKGRFATAGVSGVDAVLGKYGVTVAEELMPLTGAQARPRRMKTYAGHEMEIADLSKLYCVKGDASLDVEALAADLAKLPEVEFAEPNYIVYTMAAKDYMSDPLWSEQWGPSAVGLPALWDAPVINKKRPKIAILDTGVDIAHPDLQPNIWTNEAEANGQEGYDDDGNGLKDDYHGWDFVNQTGVMDDYNGHGTHCAGIAAAAGGNGKGIVGANPEALIIPVTVMQSDGTGDVATIVKGIDYATSVGADVISMSFGGYTHSIAEEQALGRAYHSAVLVAAAGNDGLPICPHQGIPFGQMFPAAFTFVLGVQCDGGFSNYDSDGPVYFCPVCFSEEQMYNYELTAPGTNIMSTYPGGRYKKMNGTSMACPLVAGAVSRLMQCKEYPTKELLFGDLIHSAGKFTDFLAAYKIEDKDRTPNLRLVSWRIDDKTDGDGRFDAGEEVEFYPIIRNDWGTAQNIKVWAELGENEGKVVEFSQTQADFSKPLSSYAKAESAAPIRFKVADDVVDGRHIRLVVHAQCDGMAEPTSTEIVITAENGIEIGGIIEHDTTLKPGVSYIVTKTIAVPDGVTLTILPGTVLKFSDNTGIQTSKNDEKSGRVNAIGTPENPIIFTKRDLVSRIPTVKLSGEITFRYIHANFIDMHPTGFGMKCYDCLFKYCQLYTSILNGLSYHNCHILNSEPASSPIFDAPIENSNFINNPDFPLKGYQPYSFSHFSGINIINIRGIGFSSFVDSGVGTVKFDKPWYWGSAVESTAREKIWDIESGHGTWKFDLSNMLTQPNPEAHGIVWRVMVNGYDAQDEFDKLPPLGVGKHKFEVWYSKKVDETQTPFIAMGVRPPYTQTAIAEDGSWRTEITQFNNNGVVTEVPVSVYTAYLTIKGNMAIDGLNRIYVSDGHDLEFFDIPLENTRFNVEVASAGSMSAGFMGEAGLGKVSLTWDPQDDLIEDIMGYNLYRYTLVVRTDAEGNVTYEPSDTVRINTRLLDQTQYVDYDVLPGVTYNYYYKILRTSMTENSPSRTVAVTPLTAQKGDANGSMSVDIADVMTEVSYLTGGNPQPFIFEAADVNSDQVVDILDVVRTVNLTLTQPDALPRLYTPGGTAKYWIENGTLWVESDVPLGGVQVSVEAPRSTRFTPLEGASAMETAGAWVTTTDGAERYRFLCYSMSGAVMPAGRHALLSVGQETDTDHIADALFSSPDGENVVGVTASVGSVGIDADAQMLLPTPNPFTESVTIPFVVAREGVHRVEILFTDLGGTVVNRYNRTLGYGRHSCTWTPRGIAPGLYLVTLTIDGRLMQTAKLIKK